MVISDAAQDIERRTRQAAVALSSAVQSMPLSALPSRHRETLTQAIANVLSVPIAEVTYGQIVDGIPLSDVLLDYSFETPFPAHPLLFADHDQLPANSIDKVRQLRNKLDLNTILHLNAEVLQAFQTAYPGSRQFNTRLIELVAIAIHQIAAWLYKNVEPLRPKDDPLMAWRPDLEGNKWHKLYYPDGFPPTLFRLPWYAEYDQYPEGVADGVGYWAENRILGGIVLFGRREPGSAPDVEPDAIYYHTEARGITYRIYRLCDNQKQDLLQLLLANHPSPESCPLPIHGDQNNQKRFDPEEPMKESGIYRDKWERNPLFPNDTDYRTRDVVDTFNFLSFDDWFKA